MLSDNQRNALQVMQYGYPTLWATVANGYTHDNVPNSSEASRIIGAILKAVYTENDGLWPWKYWTKQSVCAQALFECKGDVESAVTVLLPSLGKIKALRFQRNQNGRRVDLSLPEQKDALRTQLRAVAGDVKAKLDGNFEQNLDLDGIPEGDGEEQQQKKQEKKAHPWISFIRKAREFFEARKADGHELDEWGLRQAEYGALLLKAGIGVPALKHASTMHLPPEARRALGVTEYDVTTYKPEDRKDGKHASLPYCLTVVKSGVPLALIGPKGTGKTTLAKHIAEELDLPFGMVSMTSATSPSAFNGRPRIASDGTESLITAMVANGQLEEALDLALKAREGGDVVASQFAKLYGTGGVFLFDEMDAADENLLLIVNAALANGVFFNTATGEQIDKHPNFVPIAGMNTMGLGAGRDYNSRNKLDAASLDRWGMGRVQIRLDERVEDAMFYGILNS